METEKKQPKIKNEIKTQIATEKTSSWKLLVIIRIAGEVKKNYDVVGSLDRLRLRRKYACVLMENKPEIMGIIKRLNFYVAYGEIEKETLVKLLKARAHKIDKKTFDAEKIAEEITSGKKMLELGFKPFFRLHPPRGGIKSKLAYPRGVLGNNKKDINKLVERML